MMTSLFPRHIPHVYLVLLSLSLLAGCREDESVVAPSVSPTIISFSPTMGRIGTSVVILGHGFPSSSKDVTVSFGTVPATVLSIDSSQIIVHVPDGTSPGKVPVSVEVLGNLLTAADRFMVMPPAPPEHIAFAPLSGPIGTRVVITGDGFGTSTKDVSVRFGEVVAPAISIGTGELVVRVPEGASPGNIPLSVETPGGIVTAADSFRMAVFNPEDVLVEVSGMAVMVEDWSYIRRRNQPTKNTTSTGPEVEKYLLRAVKDIVDGCNGETRGDTIRFCHKVREFPDSFSLNEIASSGTIVVDTVRKVVSSMTYTYRDHSETTKSNYEGETFTVSWNAYDLPYNIDDKGAVVMELRGAAIPGHFLSYAREKSLRTSDTFGNSIWSRTVKSILPCPDSAYVRITLKP